jgi:CO/xanthine dehydrogenase Mo-binding subunit
MEENVFGHSVIRKEGREKVTGRAQYVDDLAFPDIIHGVTVRSSVARDRILGIRYGEDIPGTNKIALFLHDPPYLASEFINHPEEPVVLLAHGNFLLRNSCRF